MTPMARRTPRHNRLPAARNGDMGRPSHLTERTADAVVHAVLEGNHLTTAAASAGIGRRTLYQWLEKADVIQDNLDHDRPVEPDALAYVHFAHRLEEARALAEMGAVAVVRRAMRGGDLIRETPVQNVDGDPVYDQNGKVLYDRTWTQPDGRLALQYLGRSNPGVWGQNAAQRVELTGAAGGPVQVEHSAGEIEELADRVADQIRRRATDAEDGFEVDEGPDDGEDAHDVEWHDG